ncbi:MAG: LamG-like jellyroll fold domain-containing protein [Ardenticatenales bacterium]
MSRPPRSSVAVRTSLLVAVLATLFVPANPPVQADAAAFLRDAWRRTERAGRYAFETHLTQTTLPAPAITSAGRRAKVTTLFMSGTADQGARRIELTLWNDSRGAQVDAAAPDPAAPDPAAHDPAAHDPAKGLAMRIEEGQASARAPGGAWKAVDGLGESLAPAGDAAAFLGAAKNVRPLGAETRTVPTASGGARKVSFQRYAFALDGEAYAAYLRGLATTHLAAHGTLPAGVTLADLDRFKSFATRGEAWIDADGLPLRMTLTMEHPQARDGTRTTVEVRTDFTGYDDVASAAGSTFWSDPLAWVGAHVSSGAAAAAPPSADVALLALVLALGYGLVGVVRLVGLGRRRARLAYSIVATVVVVQLTVMPLVNAELATGQLERFFAEAWPARSAHAAEAPFAADPAGAANPAGAADPSGAAKSPFDPRVGSRVDTPGDASRSISAIPRVGNAAVPSAVAANLVSRAMADGIVDTDGDGLSDVLERLWGTSVTAPDTDGDDISDYDETIHCPVPAPSDPWTAAERAANGKAAGCPDPTKKDTDGDGLTDGEELLRIGTAPNRVDTDGDQISDWNEVKGYALPGNKRGYTDARNPDTDGDGLSDGLECPSMRDAADPTAPFTAAWTPVLACVDSGVQDAPDVDNIDNDGDGVPNRFDTSPFVGGTTVFDHANPLTLEIDGLQPGKPVVVDVQIRPTNPTQLSFAQNVLDWPTGDNQGQVQRRLDNTIGDTYPVDPAAPGLNPDPSDPAFGGDMRLSPMLEVTLPGDSNDLPRTTAKASLTLDDAGESVGRIVFSNRMKDEATIESAQARVDALIDGTAALAVAKGRCGTGPAVIDRGAINTTDRKLLALPAFANLGALANGQHIAILDVGALQFCAPIPSLVEGETSIALSFQRTTPAQIDTIGTVEIAQDGPVRTSLAFAFADPARSYDARIRDGRCGRFGAENRLIAGLQGNVTRTMQGTNAVDLADGKHVITVDQAGKTVACASLGNIVSGFTGDANRIDMIDAAQLRPYQITVHEEANGDLVTLAPLARTTDGQTGAPVAFNASLFYRQAASATLRHQVRLLWLVSMVNDDGRMEVIHQYANEAWRLTGLAVREEHGIDVAVADEDPTVDERIQRDSDPQTAQHLEVDDNLWALAGGLESTFLGNRTNAAGARTMTVAEIAKRWEGQPNDYTAVQRWNIAPDALNVRTFRYATTADLGALGATEIPAILKTEFGQGSRDVPDLAGNPVTTLVPTLLVATESRTRSLSLDAAAPDGGGPALASVTGGTVALHLDPARVGEVTTASMSWKPYRYDVSVGGWTLYPLEEYWRRMEKVLTPLKAFKDQAALGDEGRYETAADVAIAQVAYTRLFAGVARVVQIGPTAVRSFDDVPEDDELARIGELSALAKDEIGDRIIDAVIKVSTPFIEEYKDHRKYNKLNSLVGLKKEPYSFRGAIGRMKLGETTEDAIEDAVGEFAEDSFSEWKQRLASKGPDAMRGAAVMATLIGSFVNAQVDPEVGVTPENVVGLTLQGLQAADSVVEIYRVFQAFQQFKLDNPNAPTFKAFLREVDTSASARVAGVVGWLVGTSLSFGLFFEGVARSGIEIGGAAFNDQLVHIVAESVLDGVLAAIALTGWGTVTVMIISLIDAFVTLICSASPPDEADTIANGACMGIQGLIGEAIATAIYDETDVVNLSDPNRLTFRRFNPYLDDPIKAFVPAATLHVELTVRNTITVTEPYGIGQEYPYQFSERNAKASAFAYAITADQLPDSMPAVKLGDTKDWTVANHVLSMERDVQAPVALSSEPGINRPVDAWLAEAYEINVQQCAGLGIAACWVKTRADSSYIDLGLAFDVFPTTLDAFYTLAPKGPPDEGGQALAWGQTGPLTFPVLADADGDGLHRSFDPDDRTPDLDADGVPDLREKQIGSDPRRADSDGDQLSDADELRLGTDPLLADTDGDGLTDDAEKAGWPIAYNAKGDRTWVYPAPRKRDADGDGIADSREKDLGFSPWAVNDGRVLNYTTELREPTAPSILMRMDEPAGATTIADTSQPNSPYNGYCSAPSCPVTGHSALMGNSALFDGKDDYFSLGAVPEISALTNDFMVSAWIMPARVTGRQRIVGLSRDQRADGFGFGLVDDGLILTYYDVDEFIAPNMGIPVDTWTWVAASAERVVDPGSGAVSTKVHFFAARLAGDRIDGTDKVVTTTADGALPDRNEPLMIGGVFASNASPGTVPPRVDEAFEGRIDEVVIVREPLRAGDDVEARLKLQMLGVYNLDDGVVAPGQRIVHKTSLTNRLLSKNVSGLLKVDVPDILKSDAPAYQNFALGPAVEGADAPAETKILHPLTVSPGAPSGDYDIAQDMAATIDRRTVPLGNLQDKDYVRSILYDLDRAFLLNENILDSSNRPLSAGNARYDGGDITIAAWVNWHAQSWQGLSVPGVRHGIMGAEAGRDQEGAAAQWMPKSTTAMSRGAFPSLLVEDGYIVFGFGCTDPDNGWCEVRSNQRYVNKDEDVHVAVSYNRTAQRAKLYIDQEYKEDLALTGMVPRSAEGFVVGSANEYNYALRSVRNACATGQGSYTLNTSTDDPAVPPVEQETVQLGPPGAIVNLDPVRYLRHVSVDFLPGKLTGSLDYLGTIFDTDEHGHDPTEAQSANGCAAMKLRRHAVTPFSGLIWDLEVYARALDQAQITDIGASNTTIVRYKLDEVPGQTRFEDYVGGSGGTCEGDGCPVAGVRGRENLAAAFDGVDDHIFDSKAGLLLLAYLQTPTDTGYSFGAWVRPGPAQRTGAFLSGHFFAVAPAELRAVPVAGKPDKVRFWFGQGDDDKQWSFPPNEYVRDDWHHVIVAVDTRQPTSKGQLYVDGVAVGAPFEGSLPGVGWTIGSAYGGARPYEGLIDDVFIGKGFLDVAGVRALMNSVPFHSLTMDDPRPAADTWPALLAAGQINESRQFIDPSDRAIIGGADQFNLYAGDFTLSAWVLGDALSGAGGDPVLRPIVTAGDGSNNPFFGLSNGRPYAYVAANGRTNSVIAEQAIPPNMWTHVLFRRRSDPLHDNNEVMDIFVQGASVKRAATLPKVPNPTTPPQVTVGGSATGSWHGRLDEVTFYRSALNDEDIARLFNFQNTWIDETSTAPLTVDGEPPTAAFPQSGEYVPLGEPTTLTIDTHDVHSAAQLAVLEFRTPGRPVVYAWGLPCRDAVHGSAMCPAFDPPAEGRYDVTVDAVDKVGNVQGYTSAAGEPFTVIVDGTAPVLTLAPQPSAAFRPAPDAADPTRWTVPLAGTVTDPAIGANPGSGVARVDVVVHDANGTPLGEPALQHAIVVGGNWHLAYALRSDQPTGTFSGEVTAVDRVGKSKVLSIPPFHLDSTDPATKLTGVGARAGGTVAGGDRIDGTGAAQGMQQTAPDPGYLGSSALLQGRVDEQSDTAEAQDAVAGVAKVQVAAEPLFGHGSPFVNQALPPNVLLYLPFDKSGQPSDAAGQSYVDLITGRAAACAAPQCPQPGITGPSGQALRFDGADDALSVPHDASIGALTDDFTVGAWIRTDGRGANRRIVSSMQAGQSDGWSFGLSGSRLRLTNGLVKVYDSDAGIVTAGVWQHVAVHLTADDDAEFYVNGRLVQTVQGDRPAVPDTDSPLLIGAAALTGDPVARDGFNGAIDAVVVATGPIAAADWPTIMGLGPTLRLGFDERSIRAGGALADAGMMGATAAYNRFDPADATNHARIGVVGAGALELTPASDGFRVAAPTGVLPVDGESFTLSLWIEDMNLGRLDLGGDAVGFDAAGLTPVVHGAPYPAPVADSRGWHHYAIVWDEAAGTLSTFQDGALLRSDAVAGGSGVGDDAAELRFTHQSPSERYALDDVRVYRRALPVLELAALAAARWTDAAVAGAGANPAAATWTAGLPAGLEGYYDVKVRGADAVGNIDDEPKAQWSGIVDTLAPRFLGGFAQQDDTGIAFELRFEDFSLDPSRLTLPGDCANDMHVAETPYRSPWHLALAEQLTDAAAAARLRARTYGATITCHATYAVADETMSVCDRAGNCQRVVYNGPSVGSPPPTPTAGPTPAVSPTATGMVQGTPTATRRPGGPTVGIPTATPPGPRPTAAGPTVTPGATKGPTGGATGGVGGRIFLPAVRKGE